MPGAELRNGEAPRGQLGGCQRQLQQDCELDRRSRCSGTLYNVNSHLGAAGGRSRVLERGSPAGELLGPRPLLQRHSTSADHAVVSSEVPDRCPCCAAFARQRLPSFRSALDRGLTTNSEFRCARIRTPVDMQALSQPRPLLHPARASRPRRCVTVASQRENLKGNRCGCCWRGSLRCKRRNCRSLPQTPTSRSSCLSYPLVCLQEQPLPAASRS